MGSQGSSFWTAELGCGAKPVSHPAWQWGWAILSFFLLPPLSLSFLAGRHRRGEQARPVSSRVGEALAVRDKGAGSSSLRQMASV